MSSDLTKNSTFVKALSAGVFAGVADKMVRGTGDSTASAIFGTSVGTGILITSLITAQFPMSESSGMTSGVVSRAIEVGATTGGAYLVYTKGGKMFFPNVRQSDFDMKSVGIIVASNFFGEYVKDWVLGEASMFD